MSEHVDFELQMNLEEVDAWGGESGPRLPPGVYDVEITAAAPGSSKTTQKPTLDVEFTVVNEGEHYGTAFNKKYSLQPQALGRIKNVMIACGARLDAIRGSELLGKQIVIEIVHRQGDPQPQPDGTMVEGKMFMDVINERSPEAEAQPAADNGKPEQKQAPATPPTAQVQAQKTTAVRRAVGKATA